MNLLISLLLLTAALAVIVRILDARRTAGVVLLGLLALSFSGLVTNRLARLTGPTVSAAAAEPADAPGSTAATGASQGEAEAQATAESAKEEAQSEALSIEVQAEPGEVIIPPRPSWVDSDDVREGDLHTTAVSSGPHETQRECRTYLDRELKRAVDSYIDWYLGRVYGDQFRASTFVSYDLPYIKKHLVRRGAMHHEVIKVSFGPMHQMHALLEFDPAFRSQLEGRRGELNRHWREWVVKGRLWGTALGLGTILALLSVFFGYSRADTATRGFYTGRLQLVAAVVILTIIAAGALLALRLVA